MARRDGFQRSFGRCKTTFNCETCGRSTRATNSGNEFTCPECYECSGLENSLSDNGREYYESVGFPKYARKLVERAVKKGGDRAKLEDWFERLF